MLRLLAIFPTAGKLSRIPQDGGERVLDRKNKALLLFSKAKFLLIRLTKGADDIFTLLV